MVEGTKPRGTRTEQEAARHVQQMFGAIAPRYDLLNHLLSFQIDKYWRRRTVKAVQPILNRPDAVCLDLCCGTGDLLLALRRQAKATVLGADFSHPMLVEADRKASRIAPLFEGDALRLPLADGSLDLITVAFGFRNFANYEAGLVELRRVLKPGGTLACLEFSTPPNALFRAGYNFYSTRILPLIGGLISGSRDAYTYLPESVQRFPGAEGLAERMLAAGYSSAKFRRMTGGIVALHLAVA